MCLKRQTLLLQSFFCFFCFFFFVLLLLFFLLFSFLGVGEWLVGAWRPGGRGMGGLRALFGAASSECAKAAMQCEATGSMDGQHPRGVVYHSDPQSDRHRRTSTTSSAECGTLWHWE